MHVKVTGENSVQNVKDYLREVNEVCVSTGILNVLVEENLSGPSLNTLSIYEIIKTRVMEAKHPRMRMAYVDVNPEHDKHLMAFAEIVAVNRGLNAALFNTVTEAENWISQTG